LTVRTLLLFLCLCREREIQPCSAVDTLLQGLFKQRLMVKKIAEPECEHGHWEQYCCAYANIVPSSLSPLALISDRGWESRGTASRR